MVQNDLGERGRSCFELQEKKRPRLKTETTAPPVVLKTNHISLCRSTSSLKGKRAILDSEIVVLDE